MKIIIPGDLKRLNETRQFKCKACGCVFEADKGEYKFQYSQREDLEWYEIRCPTCQRWVQQKKDDR